MTLLYLGASGITLFLAGVCAGVALSSHPLNKHGKQTAQYMVLVLLAASGLFAYASTLNGLSFGQ